MLLLASGAACGDRGERLLGGGDDIEPGGTAILAESADMNHPSPLLFMTVFDGSLASDIMNMELIRGEWRDGQLEYATAEQSPMAIARRYEFIGPDSATLRFHMRSDVQWSDGTPLTAHDVVFTYRLAGNTELASPRMDMVAQLDSITAQNDSVVTFHFRRRYPEMFAHAALPPMPRHIYEGTDPAQLRTHPSITSPAGNLVVSGPFMISQHVPGQRIVLDRNPHFRPQPHLEQIVFRIIPEPTTRLVELEMGNLDFVQSVTFDQIPRLRQQAPHVRWETQDKRTYEYIAYNPSSFEPFADPEIRRALGLAIDSRSLIEGLQMEEFAAAAGGPYAPIFRNLYDESETPPLPYDIAEARRILTAKGWVDTDGDGILERNGRPFRFTLLTNSGNQRRTDATQIIQQQWRRAGIDAQLRTLEFNTFMGRLFENDFEAALGGWQVALTPDLSTSWGATSPLNITQYRNPELSRLFELARAQPTAETANPYWRQAAVTLTRDQPYTWLYYFDSVHGVHERLRGVKVDSYGSYQNTWEWWIPAEMRRGGARAAPTSAPLPERAN